MPAAGHSRRRRVRSEGRGPAGHWQGRVAVAGTWRRRAGPAPAGCEGARGRPVERVNGHHGRAASFPRSSTLRSASGLRTSMRGLAAWRPCSVLRNAAVYLRGVLEARVTPPRLSRCNHYEDHRDLDVPGLIPHHQSQCQWPESDARPAAESDSALTRSQGAPASPATGSESRPPWLICPRQARLGVKPEGAQLEDAGFAGCAHSTLLKSVR